jgi:hypothetical protein
MVETSCVASGVEFALPEARLPAQGTFRAAGGKEPSLMESLAMRHVATLFAAASFAVVGAVAGCQTDTMGHSSNTSSTTTNRTTTGSYYPSSYDRNMQTTGSYDRATTSGASSTGATGTYRSSGELVPMDRTM